ncbi:MAG: helix-turn-helix domain-containing protein [Vicinamibacterales bacterium]
MPVPHFLPATGMIGDKACCENCNTRMHRSPPKVRWFIGQHSRKRPFRHIHSRSAVCNAPGMARPRRILYGGAIYHVMARGNRRTRIFADDFDRLRFLEILGEAQQRYAVRWRSFALMTSHYHAAAQTRAANLSEVMQYVNSQFARAWNRRRRARGHVFGERFVSKPIEDDRYAITALKYIAWNPVVAGYVKHPDDWIWSSHRATAGLAAPPEFLDLDWLRGFFGRPTLGEAQDEYRHSMAEPLTVAESEEYLNTIVIGSEDFQEAIRKQLGITMHDLIIPRSYRALARPTLAQLFAGCGDDLEDRNRAIRRAQIVYGYRQYEIARTLNLHPNTVSKIVSRLAKQRFFLVRVD